MNHNFLRFIDKKHRKYEPDSKYKNTLLDYYKFIDGKLGELLELLDEDTRIIVLSDHGIIRMHNRVNLSDWLINDGYLILKDEFKELKEATPILDWSEPLGWKPETPLKMGIEKTYEWYKNSALGQPG